MRNAICERRQKVCRSWVELDTFYDSNLPAPRPTVRHFPIAVLEHSGSVVGSGLRIAIGDDRHASFAAGALLHHDNPSLLSAYTIRILWRGPSW